MLPTLEFGDVKIPTNYKAAMTSPQATYWREALNKEYEGLMAMNTWETIEKDDVPQDATLLNCHVVWALKKKGSGEIEKFKARLVADGNTPGLRSGKTLLWDGTLLWHPRKERVGFVFNRTSC